jgi:hypothetical protein
MPKEKKELAVVKKGLPDSVQLGVMLDEETKRQKVLDKFIQENLKTGTDYGIIPGTQKPTLFKSGAEKVIGLFNIRAEFSKDTDTLEMLGLKGAVAYKCTLINRTSGEVVGEGRGVAMPAEKSSWTPNTQVKIAEKRAMVDAVLQTFGLSSRYTQDMEDMPTAKGVRAPQQNYAPTYDKKLTDKQYQFIGRLLDDLKGKLTQASLEKQIGKKLEDLTMADAKKVIDQLLKLKGGPAQPPLPVIDKETGEVLEGEIVEPSDKITMDDIPQ